MRTRSQSREQRPPPPEEPPVVIEPLRIEYPFQEDPTVEPMAGTLNMASIVPAPTRGSRTQILILKYVGKQFRAKAWVINLVQNKQFSRFIELRSRVETFWDKIARECKYEIFNQAVSSDVLNLRICPALLFDQEEEPSFCSSSAPATVYAVG
ncbi:hypothetical protein Tco_1393841 [Tanacetum coccineum]